VFTVKSNAAGGSKATKQQAAAAAADVFEVSPGRAQIPAQGHVYAVVTFSPTAMQVIHLSRHTCTQQCSGLALSAICGTVTRIIGIVCIIDIACSDVSREEAWRLVYINKQDEFSWCGEQLTGFGSLFLKVGI